ncbi:MAG: response regulator [Anaerolineae bacterium]|nr:response regulator [Anaerolineae bacterium]
MTHIVVVDPNQAFAMLLTDELQRQGYDVQSFEDGSTALDSARSHPPDMALLDIALKDPDTFALAKQLRELSPSMRLVLIPMMGEQIPEAAAEIPVQGVLPKPFFIPELPARIAEALQSPLLATIAVSEPAAPAPVAPPPKPQLVFEPDPQPEPQIQVPQVKTAPVFVAPEPVQEEEPESETEPESQAAGGGLSGWGLSSDAVLANKDRIRSLMDSLAQELAADCVLLTLGRRMVTSVGHLNTSEADAVARAVVHGWMTSEKVARILGQEQRRFEQSITGDDYMLYAISVDVNALLAVAIRGTSPLGLLRHRARETSERIYKLCS